MQKERKLTGKTGFEHYTVSLNTVFNLEQMVRLR